MGDRSAEKKKHIISCARTVFASKGYRDVTMKDIVEACDISRGGLYLYYDNTAAIFQDVLKLDEEEDEMTGLDISEDMTNAELLAVFLKEQKKLLLKKKNQLTMAIYEYYFASKETAKENMLQKQFDDGVRVVSNLIAGGVADGDFVCEDPEAKARNIMYVLEGLRIMSQTCGLSGKTIDQEILSIMKEIVTD